MKRSQRRESASSAEQTGRSFETESLSFQDSAGNPLLAFSPEVIGNLRHMVTQMFQKNSFPRRLALTSALSGEGVSYVSRALGTIMANDMAATLCIVDLNWWSPAAALPDGEGVGLADVVSGSKRLIDVIYVTGQANLSLVPAGATPPLNRPIIARSTALRDLLDELDKRFDYLILDVPAVLTTSDAIALASLATGVALVVQQGVTNVEKVRLALDDINHLPVSGVILNRVETRIPEFILNLIPQA